MVDFKDVKNAAALKADTATKEELDILIHQNINETLPIGEKGIAQIDIRYQMDKTFVYPVPSGTVQVLNGYVAPEQVKEWFIAQLNGDDDRKHVVKDADAKS